MFLTLNIDYHLPVLMNALNITTNSCEFDSHHYQGYSYLFVKFCQLLLIDWCLMLTLAIFQLYIVAIWLSKVSFFSGFLPPNQLIDTICSCGFKEMNLWEAAMKLSIQRICHNVERYFSLHWTYIYSRHKQNQTNKSKSVNLLSLTRNTETGIC